MTGGQVSPASHLEMIYRQMFIVINYLTGMAIQVVNSNFQPTFYTRKLLIEQVLIENS